MRFLHNIVISTLYLSSFANKPAGLIKLISLAYLWASSMILELLKKLDIM